MRLLSIPEIICHVVVPVSKVVFCTVDALSGTCGAPLWGGESVDRNTTVVSEEMVFDVEEMPVRSAIILCFNLIVGLGFVAVDAPSGTGGAPLLGG